MYTTCSRTGGETSVHESSTSTKGVLAVDTDAGTENQTSTLEGALALAEKVLVNKERGVYANWSALGSLLVSTDTPVMPFGKLDPRHAGQDVAVELRVKAGKDVEEGRV